MWRQNALRESTYLTNRTIINDDHSASLVKYYSELVSLFCTPKTTLNHFTPGIDTSTRNH